MWPPDWLDTPAVPVTFRNTHLHTSAQTGNLLTLLQSQSVQWTPSIASSFKQKKYPRMKETPLRRTDLLAWPGYLKRWQIQSIKLLQYAVAHYLYSFLTFVFKGTTHSRSSFYCVNKHNLVKMPDSTPMPHCTQRTGCGPHWPVTQWQS